MTHTLPTYTVVVTFDDEAMPVVAIGTFINANGQSFVVSERIAGAGEGPHTVLDQVLCDLDDHRADYIRRTGRHPSNVVPISARTLSPYRLGNPEAD